MKKILFVTNHMQVGGVQKSLLELLKVLAKNEEYEISLFCCKHSGDFLQRIPKQIKILPENAYALVAEQGLSECNKQGIKFSIIRMVSSLWSKCFTKALPSFFLCKLIGKIGENYDVAISYSQPIGDHEFCNLTNEIVLNCIYAPQIITFVHCDFGLYGGNTKRNRKLYKKFDRIAAVSESVGRRFAQIVPEIFDKVQTVYNFCDFNEIKYLAEQSPIKYKKKAFVTVARLSKEKGILRCIPIFYRLKKEGFDFEWHIVGGGSLLYVIEESIDQFQLQINILMEGEQLNPYRFMKNADYLLSPSFHEAAPIVFDEAFALGLPILATRTLSAVELVEDRNIGVVCENDENAIYDMLYDAITNNIRCKISSKFQNKVSIEQFKDLCK